MAIKRRITGFRQDGEKFWVAELECGHTQHMRHNPPWEVRPWVLNEATRQEKIGSEVECVMCRVPFTWRRGP